MKATTRKSKAERVGATAHVAARGEFPHVAAVDVFCGIGGLTRGLLDAGLDVVAGIDVDDSCEYPYSANNKALFIPADVRELRGRDLRMLYPRGSTRVLAGCAPCQPFSPLTRKLETQSNGQRHLLLAQFGRLVDESDPHIVTMENVPDVQSTKVFSRFVGDLEDMGYIVTFDVVACVDYGVPQRRKRLVLFASKLGPIALPPPIKRQRTVADAIRGLPAIRAGGAARNDPLHCSQSLSPLNLQRIRASRAGGFWDDWPLRLVSDCHRKPEGRSFRSVYARMRYDAPSPTITTQFFNFGTGRYGHPTQDRAISLREGAMIQTFPKTYRMVKTREDISFARLGVFIGNAVPVKLGKAIGTAILEVVHARYA